MPEAGAWYSTTFLQDKYIHICVVVICTYIHRIDLYFGTTAMRIPVVAFTSDLGLVPGVYTYINWEPHDLERRLRTPKP